MSYRTRRALMQPKAGERTSMRWSAALATIFLSGPQLAAAEGPRPTQTGDQIGIATMLADRSLHMRLRSVDCKGTISEGEWTISPDRPDYRSTLDHVGDLKPTETRPVKAWPTEPCPAK
jgi:hypothetical protein